MMGCFILATILSILIRKTSIPWCTGQAGIHLEGGMEVQRKSAKSRRCTYDLQMMGWLTIPLFIVSNRDS